ncbi:hypothetical protein ACMFMF_001420 [Clarireedia jacksonii]
MLGYLLTSRSITLCVLYTLHVMLGSTLIFAGLFTYGVHSSKAMARANASAKALMTEQMNDLDLDLDLDIAVEGNSSAYASHDGEFAGVRRVKSMGGLRGEGWNANANAKMNATDGTTGGKGMRRGGEEEVVEFREVCYEAKERETVEIGMQMSGLMKGGRGMELEMS